MHVSTVLGEIEPSQLGRTLMHEHVYTLLMDLHNDYPYDDRAQDERAVELLRKLKDTGWPTIVDMTIIGLGRSIKRIIPIAQQSGMNIVPATGIYTFRDLPPRFRGGIRFFGEDFVGDFMIREITEGIGDTGVKAAVIKFVTDADGLTPDLEVLIRQSARAHLRTCVPLSTHSHARSEQGLVQQRLLREAGVDLGRVLIGHSGDTDDLGYLERLIENGSWLGMDRFGVVDQEPDAAGRIDVVAEMCRRGYAGRIVLSHDANAYSDNTIDSVRSRPEFVNWNWQCIPEVVVPGLRERGVPEADIDQMTVHNPAAILAID